MAQSKYKSLSDEDLVKESIQDIQAFEVLIQRYEGRLLRFIIRISSAGTAEAEEILQEVFLKVWKNLNDFRDDMPFSSWVYRITRNQVISQHRKNISRGESEKVSYDPDIFDIEGTTDILSEVDAAHRAQIIRDVLDLLPEKFKEVLILRYLEGQSYDEIGDILRKPPGTIATLLSRAKKAFKEAIERQYPLLISHR